MTALYLRADALSCVIANGHLLPSPASRWRWADGLFAKATRAPGDGAVTHAAPRSPLPARTSGSGNTLRQAEDRHVAWTRRSETARRARGSGRGVAPGLLGPGRDLFGHHRAPAGPAQAPSRGASLSPALASPAPQRAGRGRAPPGPCGFKGKGEWSGLFEKPRLLSVSSQVGSLPSRGVPPFMTGRRSRIVSFSTRRGYMHVVCVLPS